MIEKGELIKAVEPLMREAGEVVMSHFGNARTEIKQEGKGVGLVTEADFAAEKVLLEGLSKIVPGACFWAEESGKSGDQTLGYCWVIDPIDGTSNFAYGLPYFCISVALTKDEVPIFGAIYQPATDEFFVAAQGEGAWRNGKRLTMMSAAKSKKEIIMMCFPYGHSDYLLKLLAKIQNSDHRYSVRLFGAAALDLAYLAAGHLDGVFLHEIAWWDVAAGMVIIQEAGGLVTTFDGGPVGPDFKTFLAARPGMQEQLLKIAQV